MFNLTYKNASMNHIYASIVDEFVNRKPFVTENRNGDKAYELVNCSFQLNDTRNCFVTCRNLSIKYLHGELDFYLSGSPFLEDILKFSKFWTNVSDDGRSINSNYGKLILHDRNSHNYTQFEYALQALINNPDSKKAVMVVYRDQHAYITNDNPCTMYLHFFIREGKLHLFAKMRSNDIWFGVPYDVPFFVMIQHMMLARLRKHGYELEAGLYNHNAGSLHMYERNRVKLHSYLDKYTWKELDSVQYDMFDQIIQGRIDEWMQQF